MEPLEANTTKGGFPHTLTPCADMKTWLGLLSALQH